ncbi:HTH-type transcriptional regulator CueR [compost metagenome]|jgi:DNA-binding transcriptional MerR regulator|nr:putative transcriptional regulator [Pseudomonas sp. G5(2012)]SDS67171.1 MerR family regulatory protein [Pseudomonas umsongensis]
MRIGELAKISGLAPSRIRFYEASGLIKSVARKANGYRDYAPDTEWVSPLRALILQQLANACRTRQYRRWIEKRST